MTIRSARQQLQSMEESAGYCMPLSVDALLPYSELPQYFYDMFHEMHHDPNASYNVAIRTLLEKFFEVEGNGPKERAAIAKHNAFESSDQVYFPNIGPDEALPDFDSMTAAGISPSQVRMRALLNEVTISGCLTLATDINERGEHVIALDCIDPRERPDLAQFVIRDMLNIDSAILTPMDLSGINKLFGNDKGNYAPLPEISRKIFPDGQKSWELIILPPDPAL